jgi:hypothetical protein
MSIENIVVSGPIAVFGKRHRHEAALWRADGAQL